MNPSYQWAVKPLVPEEVYTDRQKYLDYFYDAALRATERRTMSTVLLGQRRMGKTEIFKRVVNRLFFEQDHTDPRAAVPVFFTFPDEVVSYEHFAVKYVENFLRWYTAFRMHDPSVISEKTVDADQLAEFVRQHIPVPEGLTRALNIFQWLRKGSVTLPAPSALTTPREVSDTDETTIVMFLDEFQNTHLPEHNFRIVGFMQEAVESPTCPHFVTGSAMSILVQDILGRGALFGRFDHDPIEGMTEYWGAELALRAARYYGIRMPEVMAPVVAERCGGNPFYITSVVRQASKQRKAVTNEDILSEMLAVDLSSGFIWSELHEQVSRWISKVNEYGITKHILYLAATEEEDRISLTRIQEELSRQGRQVELHTIRDVLVKLSRGDLIDYKSFGDWFGKIEDPILEEFLKVWGRTEVAGESRREVEEETALKYRKFRKQVAEYKGYLAEVFMVQFLWNSQGLCLPGCHFHSSEDIRMPDRFIYIDQRSRLGAGKGLELDIFATAGLEVWIAQSKWWQEKVGRPDVKHLLRQAEIIRQRRGEDLETLRIWLFAANGVTTPAKKLMDEQGVLWSDRSDLDELLDRVGLRRLPGLDAETDDDE